MKKLISRGDSPVVFGLMFLIPALALASLGGPVVATVVVAATALIVAIVVAGPTRVGEGLVVLGLFFAPMNAIGPSATTSFVTFADVFFVLGFILLTPSLLAGRLEVPRLFAVGAGLLLVVGTIASVLSDTPGQSFNEFGRLVASAIILPLAFLLWQPRQQLVAVLVAAYVHGSAVSFAYGVGTGTKSSDGRYGGLTEHPNALGLTALLSLAFVPYLYRVGRRTHRWYWVAMGLVSFGGIWASGSRAALLTALVLLVGLPLVERSLRAAGLVLASAAAALVFADRILSAAGGNALGRLLGAGSARGSDASRMQRIDNALATIRENPVIGSGFENTLIAHVVYLQVAAAAGVLGAIAFVLILVAACLPVLTARPPFNRLAYPAVAYVLVALITNALWDRYIWAPLALSLLGGARAMKRTRVRPAESNPTPLSPSIPGANQ